MIADLMDCKKNAIENSTRTGSADGNFNAKSWATLTSAQDFRIIYQSGQRFFTKNLGLFALRHSAGNTYPYPKIGYVASKAKAGNAPQRAPESPSAASPAGGQGAQDRQAALKELSLAARVNNAGADIESLALKTSLGDLDANGKLTDWAALRYALAYEANANLTEIGRTFLPGETLTGALASQGRVEGSTPQCGADHRLR